MLAKAGGSDGLSEISRENLSSHETISELESVAFRKCMVRYIRRFGVV